MADDVLLNKAAIIERCLQRVNEEYRGHEGELETNFTRQDSIVLNLQRACEAAIDLAMHVVRVYKLGLPQESRDAFALLNQAGLLDEAIARRMQAMVGFRNVAVHAYRKLSLPVVKAIIEQRLDDFTAFITAMVRIDGQDR
jgi:uncharacterized protein YutE (UPF0331/DUF86 family)